jgi:hypothetical protein
MISYQGYALTQPISDFCQRVNNVGMNAFNNLVPGQASELLLKGCAKILEYSGPVKETCSDVNKMGFGVFEKVMPEGMVPFIKESCAFVQANSGEAERICREASAIGLEAFHKIGSYPIKEEILDKCSTFSNFRPLLLIPVVVSGVLTVYFLYRTFAPACRKAGV